MAKKEKAILELSKLEALRQLVEILLPTYKAIASGSRCTEKGEINKIYVIRESWGSCYGVCQEVSEVDLAGDLQELARKLVLESVYHHLLAQTQITIEDGNGN